MSRARRGFSAVELATTVAIVGIVAATSAPYLGKIAEKGRLRSASREVMTHITEARTLARSGREGFAGWTDDDRVVQSGIRFVDARTYELFVDANDAADGQGEIVIATHRVDEDYEIRPTQSELRFRRNGTMTTHTDIDVVIAYDAIELSHRIEVTYGGRAKLRP